MSNHFHLLAAKMSKEAAEKFVCFDLGDVENLEGLYAEKLEGLEVRLPFRKCWFELNVTNDLSNDVYRIGVMALANEELSDCIISEFALTNENEWMPMGVGTTGDNLMTYSQRLHPQNEQVTSEQIAEGQAWMVAMLRVALFAMQCVNIKRVEHTPSEKLQKARQKRGKQPLISYWTLEIDRDKSRAVGADVGGGHASPRFHLRRGHIRQYAPGKFCWVQPCAVGSRKNGEIHKDYVLKAAA